MKFPAWPRKVAAFGAAVVDNPILLKELRAGMRGARYFGAFMIILAIVAGVILTVFAVSSTQLQGDPTLIGASVYSAAFLLNLIVAFLVVPSFGATAITSERERLTIDTLMSTTLTAGQIVWGKLLASLAQAGAIFLSTVPIVSLTFLFGGVTVRQVVASYSTLFLICILLSAWAISVSASSHTSQRAVASSYFGALLFFFLLFLAYSLTFRGPLALEFAEAYGLAPNMGSFWGARPLVSSWVRLLYIYLIPAFAFLAFVSLLLLNAAARLKSPFDEKSPPFRIYYLAVTAIGLALAYAIFEIDYAADSADRRMDFLLGLAFLSFMASSLSCLFSAESAVPPLHVRERYAGLKGARRWRWILAPGSHPGLVYCIGVNLLLAGAAILLFRPHTAGFDSGSWLGYDPGVPLHRAVTGVIAWTLFLSGVCAWLVALLPGRPRTVGVIVVILVLALSAIPIIHWLVSSSETARSAYYHTDRTTFPAPFTLVLSPVASIWTALSTQHDGIRSLPLDVHFFGLELPLHVTQGILFLAAGLLLHVRASRRRASLLMGMA